MINQIYGVYDSASECFIQFIPALNDKIASMQFETMFKQKRFNIPLIYDYPNQFKVVNLGEFDDNTGIFTNNPTQPLILDFGTLSIVNKVETSFTV